MVVMGRLVLSNGSVSSDIVTCDVMGIAAVVVQLAIRWILILFIHVYLQPQKENIYTSYLELDLNSVEPCISGPKRYTKHSFLKADTNVDSLGIHRCSSL
jgi:hypothetical protein